MPIGHRGKRPRLSPIHTERESVIATNITPKKAPRLGVDYSALEEEEVAYQKGALSVWMKVYADFVKNGAGDAKGYGKLCYAQSKNKHYKAGTISQNLLHIEWAESEGGIIGGAKGAKTLGHIRATRYPNNKPKNNKKDKRHQAEMKLVKKGIKIDARAREILDALYN